MNPEKPVAIFHGYADFPHRTGKPDIGSRFQALAASELLRRGLISKAVFLAGEVEEGQPTVAEQMVKQIRRNLRNLDSSSVIIQPVAITTREEAQALRDISNQQGWDNLISIGKEFHVKRIKRAMRRKLKREIPVYSHEDVLRSKATMLDSEPMPQRYADIIKNWEASPEERSFRKREQLINSIDAIPFVGGFTLDLLQKILRNKTIENGVLKLLRK